MNEDKAKAQELQRWLKQFALARTPDLKDENGATIKRDNIYEESIKFVNDYNERNKINVQVGTVDVAYQTITDIATNKPNKIQSSNRQVDQLVQVAKANAPEADLDKFEESLKKAAHDQIILDASAVREASRKANVRQGLTEEFVQLITPPPQKQDLYVAPGEITPTLGQLLKEPVGQDAKSAAKFVGQNIVTKPLSKAVSAKTAAYVGRFAKVARFASLAGSIVSFGVTYLVTEVAVRATVWASKHKKWFFGALGALIGGLAALALGKSILLGIAGGGALGVLAGAGLTGTLGATAGAAATFVIAFITASLLHLGVIFLITLIATPLVVAFILLVINSGAYLSPPSNPLILQTTQSPYIDVIKEAKTKDGQPAKVFENSDLPLEVTYTVTIKAKKGALKNIKFENNCRVVKKDSPPTCSHPIPTEIPDTISPTEPFVFIYPDSQIYTSPDFEDSFVTDVFTVTADVEEQTGVKASGISTIKIGTPPEECPGIWPVISGEVTVGAGAPTPTHLEYEALDIGSLPEGSPVFATHAGIVQAVYQDYGYGRYVKVQSSCNGVSFISLYAHLSVIEVQDGDQVTSNQEIGLSGESGNSFGAHLHYEFRLGTLESNTKGILYPDRPPFMWPPYIPKEVPRKCPYVCGIPIP